MFRFGVTLWSGDGDSSAEIIPFANRASAYGTPGCISIVFYWANRKAISGPGDAILATSHDAELKQPTLAESKTNQDKKITVAFDEFVVNTTPLRRDYEKVIPEPLAVLHLHYRAESILRNRGHPIPLEVRRPAMAARRQSERTLDDDDDDTTGYSTGLSLRFRDATPPQRDIKPVLLTINDDDEATAGRPSPEVIVLDSDSENEGDEGDGGVGGVGGNGGECEQETAMLAIVKNEPFGGVKRERDEISESQWKRIKREPEGAVEAVETLETGQEVFLVNENQGGLMGVGEIVWDEGLEALWRATAAQEGWE